MAAQHTILLVEDEEMLLELLTAVLEANGYRVLVARDGMESVEMYSRHKEEIALVLTDMGLPTLGGWEAFLRMKEINPNVKTIMASGFLNATVREEMLQAGAKDFVQKPYVMDQVLKRIREVIDD